MRDAGSEGAHHLRAPVPHHHSFRHRDRRGVGGIDHQHDGGGVVDSDGKNSPAAMTSLKRCMRDSNLGVRRGMDVAPSRSVHRLAAVAEVVPRREMWRGGRPASPEGVRGGQVKWRWRTLPRPPEDLGIGLQRVAPQWFVLEPSGGGSGAWVPARLLGEEGGVPNEPAVGDYGSEMRVSAYDPAWFGHWV